MASTSSSLAFGVGHTEIGIEFTSISHTTPMMCMRWNY